MNNESQFVIGIASGVVSGMITAFVLSALGQFVRKRIIPWIEHRIYTGIRIDGSWELTKLSDGEDEIGAEHTEAMELTQNATVLSGSLVFSPKNGSAQQDVRALDISGSVQDRFVIMKCIPSTRRNLSFQVFLGEISGNGNTLSGNATFYDTKERVIRSLSVEYTKKV